jgi:hypothetical protein
LPGQNHAGAFRIFLIALGKSTRLKLLDSR